MFNVEAVEAPKLRNNALAHLAHVIMPPHARMALKQAIAGMRLLLAECQGKSKQERKALFVKKVERVAHSALAGAGIAQSEIIRIVEDLTKEMN